MNQEQREEIEATCLELEADFEQGVLCSMSWPEIKALIEFARQQLNLRVDGEKAMGKVTSYCKNCCAVTEWLDSPIGPVSMCAGCGLDCCGKPIEQEKVKKSTPQQKPIITVDGQKLMERIINANLVRPQCAMDENHPIINAWEANAEEQLEALVLECLTTTPEEKE